MKASHAHLVTLKEAPADAEIVSQKLMIRAGMIRRIVMWHLTGDTFERQHQRH